MVCADNSLLLLLLLTDGPAGWASHSVCVCACGVSLFCSHLCACISLNARIAITR